MLTDWQELSLARTSPPVVVDPRRRLRCCRGRVRLASRWRSGAGRCIWKSAKGRCSAKRPCARAAAKNPCPRRGAGFWPATARCWPATGKWRPWPSQYRYLEEPPRQVGWNNWPASGCRKISAAMRPGWLRKSRSCGRSATPCSAVWLCCAASMFLSGRPGHAMCRTASSGSRPTPGGGSWKPRDRLRRPATMLRGPIASRAALHEIFEPARDAVPEAVTVAEELSRPCPGGRHSCSSRSGNPAARRALSRARGSFT